MFAVRRVEVQGAPPNVAAQVRSVLRSVEGRSLLAVGAGEIVPRVENLPSVQAATYDRDFPHTLRVRVVPEVPVAVLRSGPASWLISSRARVISVIGSGTLRGVPRIWLPTGFDAQAGAFLTGDAAAAARALRAFVNARFENGVTWARIKQGELTLGTRSGLELRLGAPADLPLKIAIVKSISPTLTRPSAGGPTYLDVSVPERPVAGTNSQVAG